MVNFLIEIERMGSGTPNEPVVILYHHSQSLGAISTELDRETFNALRHYYTLHRDLASEKEFRAELKRLWLAAQRDLICGKPASPLINSP